MHGLNLEKHRIYGSCTHARINLNFLYTEKNYFNILCIKGFWLFLCVHPCQHLQIIVLSSQFQHTCCTQNT
nr:MAG TPA: hypothetical protein [Caudoviricetes sp.]